MLPRALILLLALSLGGNAWLVFSARAKSEPRPASPSADSAALRPARVESGSAKPTTAPSASVAASSASDISAAPRGFTWKQPMSDEDFRQLADDLRAAGFPSRFIATFVRSLYLQEAARRSPLAEAPYWQRRAVESSKEMQERSRTFLAKIAPLLGPDGRPSLLLDPISRTRHYGNLPDAKIDAIAAIERDYGDMTSDVYRAGSTAGFSSESFRAQQEQTKLLESEKLADLAKILTPAELAEYQRHNSDTARTVARGVASLDLTEQEFGALYEARVAHDAANPPSTTTVLTLEMQMQRQAATSAYNERVRATLGDERFYSFLENTDPIFRTVRQSVAQFPSATPAATYAVLKLRDELMSAMSAFRNTRPAPEQIQTLYSDFNARLDATLGSEAAKVFRTTPYGRQFTPPTIRPATSVPTPRT